MRLAIFLLTIGVAAGGLFIFFSPETTQEELGVSLSWEESLGQLFLIGFEGTEVTPGLVSLMEEINPGGVLLLSRNIETKAQVARLVEDLQALSSEKTGLPLFVAVDQEGGIISRVPFVERTPQSSIRDVEHAFQVGQERAKDLKELGVNMNLAPVLDSNNPRDFLYNRTFQKGKELLVSLAEALIAGHEQEGVVSVPKHFPGYDGVRFNPEVTIVPSVSSFPDTFVFEDLFSKHLFPFVMVSHVKYEDFDRENVFPFSSKGIALTKERLGRNVLVMSDDIVSLAFLREFSYEEISTNALEAGVDVMIAAGYPEAHVVSEFYRAMVEEIEKNPALQELVQERAAKVIKAKKGL